MNARRRERRIVLQRGLAAGCTLALGALAACGPRDPAPVAGVRAGAADLPPQDAAARAGAGDATGTKASKADVQYQAQPKGDAKCADCVHFLADSKTCKLVAGPIDPNGWCTLWAQTQ